MTSATTLLEQLDDDVAWVLETNEHRHFGAGEQVIVAGQPPSAMYLLVEGVLGVLAPDDGEPLGVFGPGELVGEMSFVEGVAPSRTVAALESSTLIVVSHDDLRRRAEADPAFAARLYRALSLLLSRRLRRSTTTSPRRRPSSSRATPNGPLGRARRRDRALQGSVARRQPGGALARRRDP